MGRILANARFHNSRGFPTGAGISRAQLVDGEAQIGRANAGAKVVDEVQLTRRRSKQPRQEAAHRAATADDRDARPRWVYRHSGWITIPHDAILHRVAEPDARDRFRSTA